MYERRYGSKYDNSLSTTEIAKRIRADIKAAVTAGELPGKPVTYSVVSAYFSGGSSIDVTVRGMVGSRVEGAGSSPPSDAEVDNRRAGKRWPWLTDEARRVMGIVESIHNAYNHDGSAIEVDYHDVNYYGSVEIETEESARWRAAEVARKAARPARPICEHCNRPIRNRTAFGHYNTCEPAMAAMRARVAAAREGRS